MDPTQPLPKNEAEWKKRLPPERYRVLREKGTEPPFSGQLLHDKRSGTFVCAACGNPLFASSDKYDSGTGWPSFDRALPGSVKLTEDRSQGMVRTEVTCARCGSHLGHLFDDGPPTTGRRFCMNSLSLELEPAARGAAAEPTKK